MPNLPSPADQGPRPVVRERWLVAGAIIGLTTLFALVEATQNYLGSANFGKPVSWTTAMSRTVPSWVILGALIPGVLLLARRFPLGRDHLGRALAVHVAGAIAFALLHLGGTAVYYAALDDAWDKLPLLLNKFITNYFVLDTLTYSAIVGGAHALRFYREAKARELAASQLQASLTEARLAALRGQLNPHFLFNTLNAISTMALKGEQENVVLTLGSLGELLRVSLDERLPQMVPLADELDLLDRYLEIQRIRFGDRLTVRREVDPSALDALVPSMILQPIVENAIVHGISPVPGPGELCLRAERRNGTVLLEVTDSGPGFAGGTQDAALAERPPHVPAVASVLHGERKPGSAPGLTSRPTAVAVSAPPAIPVADSAAPLPFTPTVSSSRRTRSSGIGLANTRARLAQLYGESQTLTLGSATPRGARVSLTIPFRSASEGAGDGAGERERTG